MKNTENQKQRINYLINLLPDQEFAKAKISRLAGIDPKSVIDLFNINKPLKQSEIIKVEEAINLMK